MADNLWDFDKNAALDAAMARQTERKARVAAEDERKRALQQVEERAITPGDEVSVFTATSVAPTWTAERATDEGMEVLSWVYSCISQKAKAACSVPWRVEKWDGKKWIPHPGHRLGRLFRRSNAFQPFSTLVEILSMHLDLAGVAFISKARYRNEVRELWNVNPDLLRPVPHKTKFVSGFEWIGAQNRGQVEKVDDVIWIRRPHPTEPYEGLSPLQAAAKAVDTDVKALNFNYSALDNGSSPPGILTFKHMLSDKQLLRIQNRVQEQQAGPANAKKMMVLGADATFQKTGLSQTDLDFLSGRKFSREEICSVFGVPPPIIGIYESSTFNNIITAREIFWSDTIIPLLNAIRDQLNMSFDDELADDEQLSYDVSGVDALQSILFKSIEAGDKLFRCGTPMSEINRRLSLGLEDWEGADKSFVPRTMGVASEVASSSEPNRSPSQLTIPEEGK